MSEKEKTALVVDDEANIRDIVEKVLEIVEYKKVLTSEGYNSGIRSMREHGQNIDLVILDMNYPDGNGLKLFKDIQAQNLGRPNIGYIFMSGGYPPELVEEARRIVGDENFIGKPFEIKKLMETINRGGYKPQKPLDTIASEPLPKPTQ